MGALDTAVRAGQARYVGISSYGPRRTEEAAQLLRDLGTPLLIHQPSYSMFNRWIEDELLDVLEREGVGAIVFSPLAQGLLTEQVPRRDPRGLARAPRQLLLVGAAHRREPRSASARCNEIAQRRGQSLAQMAIAWTLRDPRVTSALLGASSVRQLEQNVAALDSRRLRRRRARGDRPLRGRRRAEHLGRSRATRELFLDDDLARCGHVGLLGPALDRHLDVPRGADPSASTALALPFRPAATCQATMCRPGLTAVTAHRTSRSRPA